VTATIHVLGQGASSLRDEKLEATILGAILCWPSEADRLIELPSEVWSCQKHRVLSTFMAQMAKEGLEWDEVALVARIRAAGQMKAIGGMASVSGLMTAVCSPRSLDTMLVHLGALAERRRMAEAGRRITEAAENLSVTDYHDLATAELGAAPVSDDAVEMAAGVASYMEGVIAIQEGRKEPDRIQTNLPIDEPLGGGFKPGWLVMVLSVNGHGKTALAVNNLALECAKAGRSVLLESLEMPSQELVGRQLGALSSVPPHVHDRPGMSSDDLTGLMDAADKLSLMPITIARDRSVAAITRRAKKVGVEGGMVVVDYLQLMSGGGKDATREEVLSQSARELKQLAVDQGCVVVLVSQPTSSAKRKGVAPKGTDTKGSGEADDAADVVLVPWLPRRADETASQYDAQLTLDKFRHGECGVTFKEDRVGWDPARVCFKERG